MEQTLRVLRQPSRCCAVTDGPRLTMAKDARPGDKSEALGRIVGLLCLWMVCLHFPCERLVFSRTDLLIADAGGEGSSPMCPRIDKHPEASV